MAIRPCKICFYGGVEPEQAGRCRNIQIAQREENPSDAGFFKLICECEIEAQKDYGRLLRIRLPEWKRKGESDGE